MLIYLNKNLKLLHFYRKAFKAFLLSFLIISLLSCEDMFLRFKYETYECGKNYFNLKKIFIKNYEVGDLVDVEMDQDGYKLEIIEHNDDFLIISREDPGILIKIEKKSSKLNVNFQNHIQNIKCKKHVFKM